MGIYNLTLSEEQRDKLRDGEMLWFGIKDGVSASLELGEEPGPNEESKEEGHKLGYIISEETLDRFDEDPSHRAGWVAAGAGKIGGGEQIEITIHDKEYYEEEYSRGD